MILMILMIYLLIIIFILFVFYISHILFQPREHMSMKNRELQKTFEENGLNIDFETYTIQKCDADHKCFSKQYSTLYFNTMESHYLAKNKPSSNSIFQKNQIPVPPHWIIDQHNKQYYIEDFPIFFPCVLKPVDGMQGKDVYTHIQNKKQYKDILITLLEKYNQLMLEKQVYGKNYRIFVFNNQIMDIVTREQPFVVGNGIYTIEELIDRQNKQLIEKNRFPTTNIDWTYIEEQGYTKTKILEKDKSIFITHTINFHNGAQPFRLDIHKVPRINQDIFIKAHQLIGLECSGIDYMSPDIYVPYTENNGHIIEINSMVDTYIHSQTDANDSSFLFRNIATSLQTSFPPISGIS